MSLTRVHNPLSSVLIRRLGDAGGPRADQVAAELDSIITGANTLESAIADILDGTTRISNVSYVIHRNTTATGNVGAGLDDLHSFSLPAGSLATNGDFVEFIYGGILATNDNDKRIVVSFDGDVIEDSALFDFDRGWFRVTGTYTRLSDTSVLATLTTLFGFVNQINGAGGQAGHSHMTVARSFSTTVADLDSNAVTMLVQAEATSNDDVVQNLSIIKLCQQ